MQLGHANERITSEFYLGRSEALRHSLRAAMLATAERVERDLKREGAEEPDLPLHGQG
jgi:hypothetical protein